MIIVLNGVSSAGKSTLARALQERSAGVWFTFGIDTLITASPVKWINTPEGLTINADGSVTTGELFLRRQASWQRAIALLAREGMPVILDEVLLRGGVDQAAWNAACEGVDVRWVAVHCDVAEARERQRGDRVVGLARSQLALVHDGVRYDAHVDTTSATPEACADSIARQLQLG